MLLSFFFCLLSLVSKQHEHLTNYLFTRQSLMQQTKYKRNSSFYDLIIFVVHDAVCVDNEHPQLCTSIYWC